jgi:hypothetical protein
MGFELGGAADILGGDDDAGAAAAAAAAGGGDGGQGGGGAGAAAAVGGDGGQGGAGDPDWFAMLSPDTIEGDSASNLDWVKAKGFKDLDGLVKAHRSAEKGLHSDGRIKVPGEGSSAEELAAFRTAIGVPEAADGYEVKLPETDGASGLELDGALIGKLASIAHDAGIPKTGFEAIANAYVEQQVEAHLANVAKQNEETQAKFAEWGKGKDQKLADCNAAARALGITKTDIATLQTSWGSGKVFDILAKIGGGIAEDVLTTGGTGRFGISPAEAQSEINRIKSDPALSAKVRIKGSPEHQRWNRLLGIVAGGKANAA